MNTNKYVISSLAASVFFFLYGWVIYDLLFADYVASISPSAFAIPPGQENLLYIGLGCLLQGFILTYIFISGLENKGLMEGVRFGLMIALFMFGVYLIWAGTSPLSLRAGLTYAMFDFVMYSGGAIIMGMLYQK